MQLLRVSVALAIVLVLCGGVSYRHVSAQTLNTALLGRYLDALRQEYGIPGLSVAVLQNGSVVFARPFGQADIAQSLPARSDTPFPIAQLSETIGATMVLRECIDFGSASLNDRVVRWMPFAEPTATFEQVLGHLTVNNVYSYNNERFGTLSGAVEECVDEPYRVAVARLLNLLAMRRTVPGRDVVSSPDASRFDGATLGRYRSVLAELATPYRVDASKTATRSDFGRAELTASTGLVSTALDLAEFDKAIDSGLLLSPEMVQASQALRGNRPTGLGWFVQSYGATNERLVWHVGVVRDAYSSMILRVPDRRLTLIMLANSDALGTSITTVQPDISQSVFARTFLRLFLN